MYQQTRKVSNTKLHNRKKNKQTKKEIAYGNLRQQGNMCYIRVRGKRVYLTCEEKFIFHNCGSTPVWLICYTSLSN